MKQFRYRDIDLSLSYNPIKRDISTLYDAEAVKRSLKHLILISLFERKMNPWVGSLVYTQLFENITPKTEPLLRKLIADVIQNYEPRVELRSVSVNPYADENYLEVYITFSILNLPEIQNLTLRLERIR